MIQGRIGQKNAFLNFIVTCLNQLISCLYKCQGSKKDEVGDGGGGATTEALI